MGKEKIKLNIVKDSNKPMESKNKEEERNQEDVQSSSPILSKKVIEEVRKEGQAEADELFGNKPLTNKEFNGEQEFEEVPKCIFCGKQALINYGKIGEIYIHDECFKTMIYKVKKYAK